MTDDRWRRLEGLYHGALDRPDAERASWLATTCDGDDDLLAEVEALLRYDEAATDFLEGSALVAAAATLARDRSSDLPGRRLDAYELMTHIGSGGMGDVYRAR